MVTTNIEHLKFEGYPRFSWDLIIRWQQYQLKRIPYQTKKNRCTYIGKNIQVELRTSSFLKSRFKTICISRWVISMHTDNRYQCCLRVCGFENYLAFNTALLVQVPYLYCLEKLILILVNTEQSVHSNKYWNLHAARYKSIPKLRKIRLFLGTISEMVFHFIRYGCVSTVFWKYIMPYAMFTLY